MADPSQWAQTLPTMWEYIVEAAPADLKEQQSILTQRGIRGWELVDAPSFEGRLNMDSEAGLATAHVPVTTFYFKRPVRPRSEPKPASDPSTSSSPSSPTQPAPGQ